MCSALERPAESRRIRTAYASSFVLCLIIGLVGLVALVLGGAPSDPGPGQGADLGRFRLIATLVAVACMSLSIAGALLLLTGVMMFSTGLLGEVLIRTYFESQGRRIYAVRELRTKREPQVTDGAR